jgi:hypothetical protein
MAACQNDVSMVRMDDLDIPPAGQLVLYRACLERDEPMVRDDLSAYQHRIHYQNCWCPHNPVHSPGGRHWAARLAISPLAADNIGQQRVGVASEHEKTNLVILPKPSCEHLAPD